LETIYLVQGVLGSLGVMVSNLFSAIRSRCATPGATSSGVKASVIGPIAELQTIATQITPAGHPFNVCMLRTIYQELVAGDGVIAERDIHTW
jgi:hypothetical protein